MPIMEALCDAGYNAQEAADGPSGLKLLEATTNIQLLVTDVGLPGGMNGRQVAEASRQKCPGQKVLFITGYAERAVVAPEALESGLAVISKPFSVADLVHKITEMLRG
jgi:CheY-like chemotaxis protein